MSEPAATPTVLLIEDEHPIRRFLRLTLASHGYTLIECSTATEGMSHAAQDNPDIVILDLGLPDMDGVEFTRQLRDWSSVPIIVLSARDKEQDKIDALDAGADDYLTKPFGTGELLARMRVALRKRTDKDDETSQPLVEFGSVRVDMVRRQVLRGNEEVHLTPLEYKLLTTLIKHAGRVITHRQLLKDVWGQAYTNENHYLRVYMGQLRHKLEDNPARPRYLITEPGVGYRFRLD